MNRALRRTLDEIQRAKAKIEDWERHLEELEARKRQLEDAEILKSVRSMKLECHELFALLEGLQSGTVSFPDMDDATKGTDDFKLENKENLNDSKDAASMEIDKTTDNVCRKERQEIGR